MRGLLAPFSDNFDGIDGVLRFKGNVYEEFNMFKKYLSPFYLWVLLSVPAIGLSFGVITAEDGRAIHEALHPTGEFAARFTIIAMMATPLVMLLPGWRGPRWLVRNRRYFGVAAFGYALLHTLFYVIDRGSVDRVMSQIGELYIWTGWVAFLIFIPLALTSMDYALRKMGPKRWKRLQRLTYVAAGLTVLHWAALDDWGGLVPALVQFSPIIALSIYRVVQNMRQRSLRSA